MEIPSEVVIELKIIGNAPASAAPFFAATARSSICTLQGVTSLHVLAIPIIGFLKSSSVTFTARNIARFGDRFTPSNALLFVRKSFPTIYPPLSFLYYTIVFLSFNHETHRQLLNIKS